MKRSRTAKFFITLFIVLVALGSVGVGGYFILDRVVVPNNFGGLGIHTLGELVEMMGTLYNNNDETDIVTNAYTEINLNSAEDKLTLVGFPTNASGELNYKIISEADFTVNSEASVELTDKELASVLNEMLKSGVLAEKLPNLKYVNTMTFELLEVIITPTLTDNILDPNSAHVQTAIKLDTSSVRSQMADYMQMPLFLLNMIVPKTLFIQVEFDLAKAGEGWEYSNSSIAVNGRTSKQSKILLNLLIDFIFPASDQMTLEKLNEEFGNILTEGMNMLGNAQFSNQINSTNQNGIILTFR